VYPFYNTKILKLLGLMIDIVLSRNYFLSLKKDKKHLKETKDKRKLNKRKIRWIVREGGFREIDRRETEQKTQSI